MKIKKGIRKLKTPYTTIAIKADTAKALRIIALKYDLSMDNLIKQFLAQIEK